MHDIIIIGAGPAGLTAALYALRAGKTVLVLEKSNFGGQMTYSPKIENYPGSMQLSGNELAEQLIEQVISHGADIEPEEVTGIEDHGETKKVVTTSGSFDCKAVIIASGVKHRMTGAEGEEKFLGEGISFCAVCDGDFLFRKGSRGHRRRKQRPSGSRTALGKMQKSHARSESSVFHGRKKTA